MLEEYLQTHDHQFGFKKQHSTDMCIFTVKSVIKYYTKQKSSVYTCFLDAAKAFDRVSHWTLFSKLIKRNIPLVIVRIIAYWYQTQPMCIKWGKITQHILTFRMVYASAGCYRLKCLLFILTICL